MRNFRAHHRQFLPLVVHVEWALTAIGLVAIGRRLCGNWETLISIFDAALKASRINPVFTVENMEVVLHPLEIVSVVLDQLGEKVGDLQEHGAAIADALDEVFTRSWK